MSGVVSNKKKKEIIDLVNKGKSLRKDEKKELMKNHKGLEDTFHGLFGTVVTGVEYYENVNSKSDYYDLTDKIETQLVTVISVKHKTPEQRADSIYRKTQNSF